MDASQDRPTPQPHTFRLGRAAFLALVGGTGAALLTRGSSLAVSVPKISLLGNEAVNGFTIYTVTYGYPAFNAHKYRLTVDGMVRNPFMMTVDDIIRHPSVTERRFYQCVTGWTVPNATWTGIRLSDLLDRAGPHPNAHAVKFYSFDGVYTESLTMPQARHPDVLLAYKLDHKPLAQSQGAPLRLVVPGMYGYKFIKWVNRVELISQPIDGYWEQNGYDRDAYIGRSNGY
ncbi:MAG TPA: molybdopterin-dependent oxidoreductase [Chloroflexota bacterium]|nr:molybdopterin-dependent oxidoreductase [Chloroflexota bacterium]